MDDISSFKKMVTCKEDLADEPQLGKRVMTKAFDERNFPVLHYMTEIGFELDAEMSRTHFSDACIFDNINMAEFILDHVNPDYLDIPGNARQISSSSSGAELLGLLMGRLPKGPERNDLLMELMTQSIQRWSSHKVKALIPFLENKITDTGLLNKIYIHQGKMDLTFNDMSSLVGSEEALNSIIKTERINKAWNDAPMGKP